ncbi:hypothetical protein CYMTET_6386 [Cymbomonas tetramitiformis]|uniref:Mutator-like transposase domain-containing protein n=1 Tax=Cymbomonas tetramitiformis TaxID=36881 RepID=A0AAE0GZ51_9CHLO|nr:hypothetical protein CYMTET_6386 [Cymbomonas tetramitiformis]
MEAAGAVLCVKSIGAYKFCHPCDVTSARVAKFTADEDSNMIAAINDPVGDVPRELQPVEKLSDPNHLQKLLYKALVDLRAAKHWSGGVLSKAVIEYFNKLYRYVIKSVAVIEDLPGFETEDEKADWIHGALLNILQPALVPPAGGPFLIPDFATETVDIPQFRKRVNQLLGEYEDLLTSSETICFRDQVDVKIDDLLVPPLDRRIRDVLSEEDRFFRSQVEDPNPSTLTTSDGAPSAEAAKSAGYPTPSAANDPVTPDDRVASASGQPDSARSQPELTEASPGSRPRTRSAAADTPPASQRGARAPAASGARAEMKRTIARLEPARPWIQARVQAVKRAVQEHDSRMEDAKDHLMALKEHHEAQKTKQRKLVQVGETPNCITRAVQLSRGYAPWVGDARARASPRDASSHEPGEISPADVIITVALYDPVREDLSQRFLVLGSQSLCELRDSIYCLADIIQQEHAPTSASSAYFYIGGTFFNDFRKPENLDYSASIMAPTQAWQDHNHVLEGGPDEASRLALAHQKLQNPKSRSQAPPVAEGEPPLGWRRVLPFGYCPLQARRMEETRLQEMKVQAGDAGVYCHQGMCEHRMVVEDVRRVHPEDARARCEYPLLVYQKALARRKCSVCELHPAQHVTRKDKLAPLSPCFFCDSCYRGLHFDAAGNQLYSFEVAPYYHE